MYFKLTLILLFTSLSCFSQITEKPNKINAESTPWEEYDISIIRLIATPEKYDGKQIQVIGYLNLKFEGNAIYLHREDYEKSLERNGFWVRFSDKISKEKNLNNFSGKYVIIAGTFRMSSHGHMGLFGGEIENITRLDIWNFK